MPHSVHFTFSPFAFPFISVMVMAEEKCLIMKVLSVEKKVTDKRKNVCRDADIHNKYVYIQ